MKPLWFICLAIYTPTVICSTWSEWWTYEGISGPDFWGLVNPDWNLCKKGKLQSPIDISPGLLVYDPHLKPLHVDKHKVNGRVLNSGHDVRFSLESFSSSSSSSSPSSSPSGSASPASSSSSTATSHNDVQTGGRAATLNTGSNDDLGGDNSVKTKTRLSAGQKRRSKKTVTIKGGPLAYNYEVVYIGVHFGSGTPKQQQHTLPHDPNDPHKNSKDRSGWIEGGGSEHTINGQRFAFELQIMAFNSDLYDDFESAKSQNNGIACVAILGKVIVRNNSRQKMNLALTDISRHFKYVKYKDDSIHVKHISIHDLLPETSDYVTYQGSLTTPGCNEVVTWIIPNKQIFMGSGEFHDLQRLRQNIKEHPDITMANNFRMPSHVNSRSIRTNVDQYKKSSCKSPKYMQYEVNSGER